MLRVYGLPALFVCENNQYSSHLDIALRQPSDRLSRYADAHRVRAEVIDGNDVTTVARAASRLVEAVRRNSEPVFLEAITYRWRGHVGPNEDLDVGVRRSMAHLEAWKRRDPVRRLEQALLEASLATPAQLAALGAEVQAQVRDAAERALRARRGPPSTRCWISSMRNDLIDGSEATLTYGHAIRDGFAWLMSRHREVFAIGQGLWSPWYVGNSMTDLDKEFGRQRVLDILFRKRPVRAPR